MIDFDAAADALRTAKTGDAWRKEPADRKRKRAHRLTGEPVAEVPEQEVDERLERVLGRSDLMPVWWLHRGVEVARAVCRIEATDPDHGRITATGFLVAPWLLMTNNHVLRTPEVAAGARISFGYRTLPDGSMPAPRSHRLDPDRLFRTSPVDQLDYTLVAVAPRTAGGPPPGEEHGWVPLVGSIGKILVGEPVNVIQHPAGRPMEIAVRDNLLLSLDDEARLTYKTDTEPGSSGSPAFNDQWELVALHHSSVEARDAAGRRIDRHGLVVTRTTPEHDRHWVANEGIRVSALVADIAAGPLRDGEEALVTPLVEGGSQP